MRRIIKPKLREKMGLGGVSYNVFSSVSAEEIVRRYVLLNNIVREVYDRAKYEKF